MYTYGRGVPQDNARAVAWLRKAAEQGNAEGEGRLGEMYVNGQGVPQDYAQAIAWLRKGAAQGHSLSQDSLGFLYETGKACRKTMYRRICGTIWRRLTRRMP
jgi:TPR repeat protein